MLPDKIETEYKDFSPFILRMADKYNTITSKEIYKDKIKPVLDKGLGGTLRLFVQKVYEGSYFTRNEETILHVSTSMPTGTTIEQMNHLIGRMEAYLSTYKETRQFQTYIYNAQQAEINIYFTKDSEYSGFPYLLKNRVINKALELGGGSWNVWGLQDMGFSNDVRESAGNFRITLFGYNYDELYEWAEKLKEKLLSYRRIREVSINSEYSWWKDDYQEFNFNLDIRRLAEENILPIQLYESLRFLHKIYMPEQ